MCICRIRLSDRRGYTYLGSLLRKAMTAFVDFAVLAIPEDIIPSHRVIS